MWGPPGSPSGACLAGLCSSSSSSSRGRGGSSGERAEQMAVRKPGKGLGGAGARLRAGAPARGPGAPHLRGTGGAGPPLPLRVLVLRLLLPHRRQQQLKVRAVAAVVIGHDVQPAPVGAAVPEAALVVDDGVGHLHARPRLVPALVPARAAERRATGLIIIIAAALLVLVLVLVLLLLLLLVRAAIVVAVIVIASCSASRVAAVLRGAGRALRGGLIGMLRLQRQLQRPELVQLVLLLRGQVRRGGEAWRWVASRGGRRLAGRSRQAAGERARSARTCECCQRSPRPPAASWSGSGRVSA
jgi:hypothetical protein